MNTTTRRSFLKQSLIAAGGIAAVGSQTQTVQAIPPFQRPFGPRMKLSCAAYSYRKYLTGEQPTMSIEGFLEECAKLGLGAAEPTSYYFPNPLTDEFLLQFKRKAFLLGLDISGTAVGNTFTLPPGPERDKQIASVKTWIDRAAVIGAPCIRIFAGNTPKGESEEQAHKWCIEATEEACEYAGKKGIFLALENHGGIVADAKGVLAIVNAVKSDWFGVNLDTGNFHGEDPYAELAEIAPYAVNVQIKVEMSSKGKGSYETDFDRVVEILHIADYRGYVALEYEAKEEPKEAIPRYIEKLRKAMDRV
ncbi:MAG: sugar phosphate isomerase/epimerase [Candidatus Omnitrophota bacterium]|nr:MAG: sugar phosphate isomerase/epimerase [Candidatus Omnitrophota bacterium]